MRLDDAGVCNACRAHSTRPDIDWAQRERAFREVVAHAQSRSKGYDCVIPVSGGKDSTWQVIQCLAYGLKPLAVTWKTPARTEIGRANLENLVRLGVDHIDYQVSPPVERRFLYRSFVKYGSTAIPMHMALFNIPLTIAAHFDIPLVVWGENSAFEYGGTAAESTGFRLDDNWLRKYGVTHGTTAEDWVSADLTRKDLTPYFGPTAEELRIKGTLAVFLGYYFPWDPAISLKVAAANGFRVRLEGPKTGYYNYADIDDDFISIHHYLKWYKFGFTPPVRNLSLEIRNGRMTREQAIDTLPRWARKPHTRISAPSVTSSGSGPSISGRLRNGSAILGSGQGNTEPGSSRASWLKSGTGMKLHPIEPPREFEVGFGPRVLMKDCGRLSLEANEQVTLTTPGGAEYDVARKSWGFYATPSLNARLTSFGLRPVLVKNRLGHYFVLLVEKGHEVDFHSYLESEGLQACAWLDRQEVLATLDTLGRADT